MKRSDREIAVLDHGHVRLEERMGGDDAVVHAARICYGAASDLKDVPQRFTCGCLLSNEQRYRLCEDSTKDFTCDVHGFAFPDWSEVAGAHERLVRKMLLSTPAHNTPFEHAVFRFHVKAPIFVARQLMRHRIASYNEQSMRYVNAKDFVFYVPVPKKADDSAHLYIEHMAASKALYLELVAQGWPLEQARAVLGTGFYTEFIWTVNAWSMMGWLEKRLDAHAQWEHRQYAQAVLDIFSSEMPLTSGVFKEKLLNENHK